MRDARYEQFRSDAAPCDSSDGRPAVQDRSACARIASSTARAACRHRSHDRDRTHAIRNSWFDTEGWAEDAARSLRDEGFKRRARAARRSRTAYLNAVRTAASARLSDLLARVGRRGVGFVARRIRAVPVPGARASGRHGRHDMPLPWCVDGQAGDVSLSAVDEAAFEELHARDGRRRAARHQRAVARERRDESRLRHLGARRLGAAVAPRRARRPRDRLRALTAFVPRNGPTELSPVDAPRRRRLFELGAPAPTR